MCESLLHMCAPEDVHIQTPSQLNGNLVAPLSLQGADTMQAAGVLLEPAELISYLWFNGGISFELQGYRSGTNLFNCTDSHSGVEKHKHAEHTHMQTWGTSSSSLVQTHTVGFHWGYLQGQKQ